MKSIAIILTLITTLFSYNNINAQVNIAPAAVCTHSGGGQTTAGYGPELLNDGVITNIPNPGPGFVGWVNSNGWFEFTWSTSVTFDSLIFYTADRGYTTMTLQYWDGTAYVNFGTSTGTTTIDTIYYKHPTTITTTKFRMFNIAGSNPNFTEVEIYFGVEDDMLPKRLVSPNITPNLCSGMYEIETMFLNKGSNNVDSFEYYYIYDNITYGPYVHRGVLAPNDSILLKFGYIDVQLNNPKPLTIITRNPNGVADGDANNDTLRVNVVAGIQGITIQSFPDTIICDGSTLVLDAGNNPNADYTWSNGQQTQEVIIDRPGTYWLFAYNNQGCEFRDTFLVNPAPPLKGNPTLSIIQQSHYTFLFNIGGLKNETLLSWDFGDGSPLQTGIGPKQHTYAQAGSYNAVLTIANECDTIYRRQTVVIEKEDNTGIDNISQNEFKIYPNPSTGILNIENLNNLKIDQLFLVNTLGQKVSINMLDNIINLEELNSGNYILIIQTDKNTYRYNIVKL